MPGTRSRATWQLNAVYQLIDRPFQHAQPGNVAAQRGVPRGTPTLSASEAGGGLAEGVGAGMDGGPFADTTRTFSAVIPGADTGAPEKLVFSGVYWWAQ